MPQTDPKKNYTILSIDGGGIRGIIPAIIIAEIEKLTGVPAYQLFDLIAGTSTGGILALGLTVPEETKTAKQMLEFYRNDAANIFAADHRHWKEKVIQHSAGLLGALAVSLFLKHSLGVPLTIPFRNFSVTTLSQAAKIFYESAFMYGAFTTGFQFGLNNKDLNSLFGAFLRGGILGGIAPLIIDSSQLTTQEKFKLIALATLHGVFTGLSDCITKTGFINFSHFLKYATKDIPASAIGGAVLAFGGPNIVTGPKVLGASLLLGMTGTISSYLLNRFVSPLLFPRYSRSGIEDVLTRNFKKHLIQDALTDVLITSYDVHARRTVFFSKGQSEKVKISDVAGATSAAPSYFPPKTIEMGVSPKTYIDGGIVANNPTLRAYAHAKSLGYSNREICIVSLGTGQYLPSLDERSLRSRGTLGWVETAIEIQSESAYLTDQIMKIIYPQTPGRERHYYRFTVELPKDVKLDDISDYTFKSLRGYGESYVSNNEADIQHVAKKLMELKGIKKPAVKLQSPCEFSTKIYAEELPIAKKTTLPVSRQRQTTITQGIVAVGLFAVPTMKFGMEYGLRKNKIPGQKHLPGVNTWVGRAMWSDIATCVGFTAGATLLGNLIFGKSLSESAKIGAETALGFTMLCEIGRLLFYGGKRLYNAIDGKTRTPSHGS